MGELLREMKQTERPFAECPVAPLALADLLRMIDEGKINRNTGKSVFEEMFRTGREAADIVAEEGLGSVGVGGELEELARGILAENADKVDAYRGGKTKLFEFFVGQVMRATKGQADPAAARETLQRLLDE